MIQAEIVDSDSLFEAYPKLKKLPQNFHSEAVSWFMDYSRIFLRSASGVEIGEMLKFFTK